MISAVISALGVILDLIEEHPDLAKKLVAQLLRLIGGSDEAADHSLEAQRGLVAGIAAAKANAVQEAGRRKAERTRG